MITTIAVAAHRLNDPANPLAVLTAQLLARVAATCGPSDELGNCGSCPVREAAFNLAAHVNGDPR